MSLEPEQEQQQEQPDNRVSLIHIPRFFPHVRFAFLNVLIIFFGYQIAGWLLMQIAGSMELNGAEVWVQGAGQVLFMLLPALALMQYSALHQRDLLRSEGGVSLVQWALGLAGILPILVFSSGWGVLQEALLPESWLPDYHRLQYEVERMYESILRGSGALGLLGAYLVGAVIPAVSEELLFRGLMQRSLEEVWPPVRAIAVTALVFGAIHFNPASTVALVLIGMYLGVLAWYTRSLALPIVVHFFNNALAITVLNISGRDTPVPTSGTMPVWQALLLVVMALAGLGLILRWLFTTPRLSAVPHSPAALPPADVPR